MKNKITIVYFLGLFWLMSLMILSCSPERKLNRLLKKHPELIKSDTIKKDTLLDVPLIKDSAAFVAPLDTVAVDSLTNHFAGRVDSLILDSINRGVKNILKTASDFDTTIKTGKVKYRIKKKNGIIKIETEIKPDSIPFTYPQVVNNVTAEYIPAWHEKALMWIGKKALTVAIVGICLLFLIFVVRWLYKQFTGD